VSTMTQTGAARTIVVPRPLVPYFHERLVRLYAERPSIEVVIDRRVGERRRSQDGMARIEERRRSERRGEGRVWSLAEMPVNLPDQPLAGGVG
jgi:hypothetical protein